MQNVKKIVVLVLFITAGLQHTGAQIMQHKNISAVAADTVPVKTFVKMQATTNAQLKEEKVKFMQLEQNPQTDPVGPVIKKDAIFIKKLNETFIPAANTSVAQKIKIKFIIDSVYNHSKENPTIVNGDTTVDYLTLVHIIDSLLKANKNDLPKVVIDSSLIKKSDSTLSIINADKGGSDSFIKSYWWLLILGLLAIAGLVFLFFKRKQQNTSQSKIFFSYAWDQDETLIMQLYSSFKNSGFNVIKDKENMGYKGVISKFMNEIGSADFVIVAISDKYLKSKFCMYELYEIFRNSGMNRDVFGRKLFPIRIEESLDLGNPDVANGYVRYWKEQEQEWTKRVKDESDSITEEQARQFQFIKRLVIDIRNILSCLADINSLNLSTLKSNDFADVKSALRNAMEAVG